MSKIMQLLFVCYVYICIFDVLLNFKNMDMKFIAQRERWGRSTWYKGRKNGFEFEYTQKDDGWYCVVSHTKKDIRFNSLWENIIFDTEEEMHKWCETWDYKKHGCLGNDVYVA